MKKVILFFSTIFFLVSGIYAQKDIRTNATRIADILAQLPAQNAESLNAAMTEMEGLGEAGLVELSRQMVPFGKSDNSKPEYAIMGYTTYVSAPGRKSLKDIAENAWIKSLSNTTDKNLTSFFMSMLEIIGTDKSVDHLASYLNDEVLCLKAAPVLASIGTAKAGKTLVVALRSGNKTSKTAILQALGYMRYTPGLDDINKYVLNGDATEKETALYALVRISNPSSESVLRKATQKNGKYFENLSVTSMYGDFIHNLFNNGHKKEAIGFASSFMKYAANGNQFAKIAALKALVLTQKEGALKALSTAAYSKNSEYRGAALMLANPMVNRSNISLFSKNLANATPDVQTSLVAFLGDHRDRGSLKTIIKLARESKNEDLKQASIIAMTKIGGNTITENLLSVLKNTSESDGPTIGKALLLVRDENLISKLLTELPKLNGFQKVIIINVLASKKASQGFDAVVAEMSSNNEMVRAAALKALPEVASARVLPQLFDLLQPDKSEMEGVAVQKAIVNSLKNVHDAEELVLNRMKQLPTQKHYLLFPALSSIGSKEAMNIVFKSYQNNTGEIARKALSALASWPNPNAMDVLFSIAAGKTSDADKSEALTGYINLIPKTNSTPDQNLLLLKKAMAVSFNTNQKRSIINQASRILTFPSLAFTAEYLDDAALKQDAASAVMNIGLSDKSFYGTLVRQWLTKAMNTLEGQDAVYMKKSIQKFLDDMPEKEGYVSLFNGRDLTGWKGLVANPIKRSEMSASQLQTAQIKADSLMRSGWVVKDGELIFLGKGDNIATVKKYGNFEMLVDWKIFDDGHKDGDAGIYLRGTPQVQIWDTSRTDVGAQVGSGGLYNNVKHESKPLKVADNKLGEWNHFYIKMVGDKVTVYLNGELVTDNIPLENYWNRSMPLWPEEQIELQAHGSRIGYRDIYIKELPNEKAFQLSEEEKKEGFEVLFDGTNMDKWQGNLTDYVMEDGNMVIRPKPGSRGNLYTRKEYKDFVFRFEFKLTPEANNGVGIRAPLEGDAAYTGMEIQILDNDADIYKNLEPYQYHGSVYGVIPAKRGFLKPVGEWNYEEIIAKGTKIQVILNGEKIVDGEIREASKNGTMDKKKHPGLLNEKGYIGFLGHGSVVYFRNIRIKEL